MAQNILSRAINGPNPEESLRCFLSQASLEEIDQTEKAILQKRADHDGVNRPEDQAIVRVADRWLEIVQEHKFAR